MTENKPRRWAVTVTRLMSIEIESETEADALEQSLHVDWSDWDEEEADRTANEMEED